MPYLLVRHKVARYDKWKPAFDDHGSTRTEAGSLGGHLFRNRDDPRELLVLFQFKDMDQARAFAASEDLKTVMKNAGVMDEPSLFFMDKLEDFPA